MPEFPLFWGTPWPWWLVVLAAGGAGALTLRGYARRTKELKAPLLAWLKVLRLLGWALIFLCLLQPIYRTFIPEEFASRVTVLADDSESMTFPDGPGTPVRLERVKTLLGDREQAASLLGKLDKSFQVKLEALSAGARPVESPAELTGKGERTDLAKGLADAFARLKGPDAGGLILISDGADNAKGDLLKVAQSYRRAGIPIYAIGIGAAESPDLAVTQVRCRRTVSKDTLAHVQVEIARSGIPAGPQTVRILRKGNVVKEATVEMSGEKATADFEFLPDEQGFLEYEAVVEPHAGELVTSNNGMVFGFVAFSRKLRVLYMEGSVYQHYDYGRLVWRERWEHEFLKMALEEDKDVEVDVMLKEFKGRFPENIKVAKEAYPKTKKELYQYDVIVNSDIPYQHFSPEQVQNTVDFVAKHGGGFCMIGGWDAFGQGGYAGTPFDRMLPVEMNASDKAVESDKLAEKLGTDAFRWQVTDEGWIHPIMQIDKDPKKNREIWDKLNKLGRGGGPSFHGFAMTTRYKPAAKVLAVVGEEQFDSPYGPMVLVAVQSYGDGFSMAFTTDSTGGWGAEWEDSWGDDDTDPDRRNIYYKIFWKNAIRWLAAKRMEAPNQLVQIETEKVVVGRGEMPVLRVKVMTQDYERTHEAAVALTIAGPDGKTRELKVFPRYEEPGVYERKLELPEVGRYEIEARAVLRGDELGSDKTVIQVRPATEELRRLSQDAETLKKVADASGGEYLPFEDAGELFKLLHKDTHVIQRHRDSDLWDNGWIYSAIVVLLCLEWFLRKRAGLP
ncbi:MAG: VWA domain-containing protein [Planctomycetota bacterium]|nr:VWA domain-containing protein [Planctomycetota bacterium]